MRMLTTRVVQEGKLEENSRRFHYHWVKILNCKKKEKTSSAIKKKPDASAILSFMQLHFECEQSQKIIKRVRM